MRSVLERLRALPATVGVVVEVGSGVGMGSVGVAGEAIAGSEVKCETSTAIFGAASSQTATTATPTLHAPSSPPAGCTRGSAGERRLCPDAWLSREKAPTLVGRSVALQGSSS